MQLYVGRFLIGSHVQLPPICYSLATAPTTRPCRSRTCLLLHHFRNLEHFHQVTISSARVSRQASKDHRTTRSRSASRLGSNPSAARTYSGRPCELLFTLSFWIYFLCACVLERSRPSRLFTASLCFLPGPTSPITSPAQAQPHRTADLNYRHAPRL